MKNFRTIFLLLLINAFISCQAKYYEIDQEEFEDYIDNSLFKVWTYDEIKEKNYSVTVPPAGPHSSAFYLVDYVQPQYTNRYKTPATGDVTFEATYFCDASISEFEVRFSYPWQDHFFVLCGPSSGSTPNQWQTKTRSFSCLSAQGCTEIELWIYGITVGPGNVVGLQNLKMVTGDSTFPPIGSTTPHTDPPTTTKGPTPTTVEHTTPAPASTTTRAPGVGLNCYSCISCPTVDENTPTLQLPEYNICVTTFFGNSSGGNSPRQGVIRGGSSEDHVNGECFMHDGMMDCYCGSDLCNNQNVSTINFNL